MGGPESAQHVGMEPAPALCGLHPVSEPGQGGSDTGQENIHLQVGLVGLQEEESEIKVGWAPGASWAVRGRLLFCGCSAVGRLLIGPISCTSKNVHDASRALGSCVSRGEQASKRGAVQCALAWGGGAAVSDARARGAVRGRPVSLTGAALRSPPPSCPRWPCRHGGQRGSRPACPWQTGF